MTTERVYKTNRKNSYKKWIMDEDKFNQIKALVGDKTGRQHAEIRKRIAELAGCTVETINKVAYLKSWEDYKEFKAEVVKYDKGERLDCPSLPNWEEDKKRRAEAERQKLEAERDAQAAKEENSISCGEYALQQHLKKEAEKKKEEHDPTSPQALLYKAMLENEVLRKKEIKLAMVSSLFMTIAFFLLIITFIIKLIKG